MNRTIRAIIGAVLILVIAFSGITISQNLGRRLKIDATERKLYTLSDGTKAILAKLTQPLTAKLYYAKTAAMKTSDQIRFFNDYYEYVKALLEEYVAASGGMIRLEVIDPRPFSDEEEEALRYGLQRFPISQEESFFFGLVIETQFGVEKVIKVFSPDRQRFVEYDISYLIDTAITRAKRKIGVMSSLPVMGEDVSPYMMQMMQAQNQQPTPPWTIVRQLRQKYEVTEVPTDVNDINDVDVLLVIHPKDLPERTQFAIDQFILKGGRTIICVDPHSVADRPQRNPMQMTVQKQASDLSRLLNTWGLDMPANTFAGDKSLLLEAPLGSNQRLQPIMGFLGLTAPKCFNDDAVMTADLNFVRVLFPGVLRVTAASQSGTADPNQPAETEDTSPITRTPLLTTTPEGNSWSVSGSFELMYPDPERLMGHFAPGDKPVVMGYLLAGRFPSSFPEGIEVEVDVEVIRDDPNAPTTETRHVTGLTEATEDCAVVVFSDVDFLWDELAYSNTFFGPATAGDNSALLLNAIEEISGSGDLISIRSRGNYTRPFEVVEKIRQEAEEETANRVALINAQIEGFNQQLQALVENADQEQQDVLSDAIIKQRQDLELKLYEARRLLREVQAKRSERIEELGNDLRKLNMAAVPGVIMVFAVVLGTWRSVRRRHYISHASDA
ncbi:MAG: Gldg family protein [Sedimentisphaerales bacterium]|nr:Gldg family protein [Sedimentisphaerales bacterium]